MKDEEKTREQLQDELARMRQQANELPALEDQRKRPEEKPYPSEELFRLIVDSSQDLVSLVSVEGYYVYVSPSHETVLGYPAQELLGTSPLDLLHPEDLTQFEDWQGADPFRFRARKADGTWIWLEGASYTITWRGRRYVVGRARNVTEQQCVEEELKTRSRQRAAVSELGQRALKESNLSALLEKAVDLIYHNLGVEYAKVLELPPEGDALLLRAGVGWQEGLVGEAMVDTGTDSQAGYTLLSNEPVIVEDLRTESRFRGPPLLCEHGVVSGMSVIIGAQERPFGVLGAHTRERRTFTKDDVNFLQTVANVLAAAIEHERAEEVLRESEERFRATFEQAAVGMVHTAPDGRWIRVNQKFCELLGYTSEELRGGTYDEVTYPGDLEENREHVRRLLAGEVESFYMEKRYVRKGGSIIWADLTASLVRQPNGDPKYFIAAVQDINSRKQAEKALRESEERYKALYEHNPMICLTTGAEGTILSANEFGAQQLGYSSEELVGRSLSDLLYEEDQEIGMRHIRRCLREPSRIAHGEFRKIRKDGSLLWVRETVRATQTNGEMVVFVICEDITEEKRTRRALEEQARLLNLTHDTVTVRDMEGKIRFWNSGAEETYGWSSEEALGKDSSSLLKTRFPKPKEKIESELLHEGRWEGELVHHKRDGSYVVVASRWALQRDDAGSPVAILETNNDITEHKRAQEAMSEIREAERRRIARDLHDVVLQDLASALQTAQFARARLKDAEMSNDLKQELEQVAATLRKASGGLRSAVYDLRMEKDQPFVRAVEALVELNRQMTPERQVRLTVWEGFPRDLPRSVREELLRILQEAITNARRHSKARHVEVILRARQDEVSVEVTDEGRGFDPHSVRYGVGLPGIRERVAALGGKLEVESEVGKGTRVAVSVPI